MLFEKADGILDLRSREDYIQGHLADSTWLSLEVLPESLNALPASPASLYLVGDKDQIEAASVLLHAKGYQVSGSLVIESAKAMQDWALQMPSKVIAGKESRTLWKPSALIAYLMQEIKQQHIVLPAQSSRPNVLDIGCGGGRDAIFMAQQRCNVQAIDHEAKVLKRAKALAALSGSQVKFTCCDIKKKGCLPDKQFDVISVVRFLNRDLFAYIRQVLKPGGVVVFETFSAGVEKIGTPKNPQFILKEGELAEVFSDFEVLVDRITTLPDGRPLNSFIAQKPNNR